jgi:hypothetical protein
MSALKKVKNSHTLKSNLDYIGDEIKRGQPLNNYRQYTDSIKKNWICGKLLGGRTELLRFYQVRRINHKLKLKRKKYINF